MLINGDFTKRAAAHAGTMDWTPSPMIGVDRRMLDRIGGEVARATSMVRYAAGSRFSAHSHDGGEEFLVLSGVFQDEHGDYPPGTYVRNPPGTRHTPRSEPGCCIFVKLHQFDSNDRRQVRIDTAMTAQMPAPNRPGVSQIPLFEDERENVRIEFWQAATRISLDVPGGLEAFVLEGGYNDADEAFTIASWLRLPAGSRLNAVAGSRGTKLWIKTGHLAHAPL